MTQYAAILIGVDRYQYFQPLSFAGADARSMADFFQQDANWSPERCLLMTDSSAPVDSKSTFPHRQNIQQWLETFCWDTLQAGDVACFFFSGYGIKSGDTEYLMPIDGDPQCPEKTGISLNYLYRQLSAPGLDAIVFLDANRSGQGFGETTAALAREFEIPTFMSCQSPEFSHEAMGLKHGIFTSGCLEALRSHPNLSLDNLQKYLAKRVPELSEHHWRPIQNPAAILPNNGKAFRSMFVVDVPPVGFLVEAEIPRRPITRASAGASFRQSAGQPGAIVPYLASGSKPRPKSRVKSLTIGLVGVSIAAGVVLTTLNQSKVEAPIMASKSIASASPVAKTDFLDRARQLVVLTDPSSYVRAIALGQEIPPSHPRYEEAQEDVAEWSQEIYEIAKAHARKREWQQAIEVAKLMPSNSPMYAAAQGAIRYWERQQAEKPLAASS
jgi:Caspase domain